MSALQRPVILFRVFPQTKQLWLPHSLWEDIVAEADRMKPLETGGILLGYRAEAGRELVVTHIVGPGPKAVHKRGRFVPDHRYQSAEVARLYMQQPHSESHALAYLGDWHSHPGSLAYLSGQDKATIRRIALTKSARASQPVMLILGQKALCGDSSKQNDLWQPTAWIGSVSNHCFPLWSLESQLLKIRVFDAQKGE